MVGGFLVIQMPDASDKRSVTVRFRPIDCFFLGFESAELMVRRVFDYIIVNGRSFRTTLRAAFDVNVRHSLLSLRPFFGWSALESGSSSIACRALEKSVDLRANLSVGWVG